MTEGIWHHIGSVFHEKRVISADQAASLYERLKPFLRRVEAWGNYPPSKAKGCHQDNNWPLYFRHGMNQPICVTWNPKAKGRPITFQEFMLIYRLTAD